MGLIRSITNIMASFYFNFPCSPLYFMIEIRPAEQGQTLWTESTIKLLNTM